MQMKTALEFVLATSDGAVLWTMPPRLRHTWLLVIPASLNPTGTNYRAGYIAYSLGL